LSHPHIAALYGFEEAEGRHLLVMELVEGETLAERLMRGPMTVDEALESAQQIADALESAHEKGIVHRDLKPANVKLAPDGRVKVLDFGLARLPEKDQTASSVNVTNSPTLNALATQAGSSSARRATCRRSRPRAPWPTTAATCSRSAPSSTRC
jgi:serine/threonine-protein kinase